MRSRLTLRARILAAFFVALVAFVGTLGYGLAKVQGIGSELGRVQDLWVPLSQDVAALRTSYPDRDPDELQKQPARTRKALADSFGVRLSFFSRELAETQRAASAANARTKELRPVFWPGRQMQDAATQERMKRVVDALAGVTAPAHDNAELLQAFVASVDSGDPALVESRRSAFVSSDTRLNELLKVAARAIDEGLRADAAAANAKAKSSLWALAGLTAVATAFGLAAIALVGRALAPIADLIAGVKRISAGDFTRRVDVPGGGEVALLAGEFNQMAESLRSRDDRLRALSAYNENVLESVRVGILVADAGGTTSGLNRAAEEIWGIPRVELVGKPLSALLAAKPFLEQIEQVRGGGPALRIGRTLLANGRTVEVSAVPFMEEGKAAGVVVVAEDVSDRARVEEALVRSERLAGIGLMSSQITHEVRNPLNSLSLNVEMLEDELGASQGESRVLLRAIASEIERLTEVTEGYLSFARLPRPTLEKSPINGVVDSLLKFIAEEAEKAGVKIDSSLAAPLPEVLADENQLRQALLNVVRNSLEALRGNGKGGRLRVSTSGSGVEGYVEVTLSDDGPGIAPKDLARIFDPFYSTKADGTGLGLPLTQQIIEEHGGTIACASSPGRGTTFTIRLPVAA